MRLGRMAFTHAPEMPFAEDKAKERGIKVIRADRDTIVLFLLFRLLFMYISNIHVLLLVNIVFFF